MTGLTEADNYYLTRYAHNPKGSFYCRPAALTVTNITVLCDMYHHPV
jgi:hypothetical protein